MQIYRQIIRISCFLFALYVQHVQHVQAQTPMPESKAPLEITADDSLEWDRDNQRFTARENAMARQGPTALYASTLTADYREGETNSMEIWQMTANQNVIIESRQTKAYGDLAVYSLDDGLVTLTGADLRLVSPDQTVTAREKFEYWIAEGRLVAIGAAKVVRTSPEGQTNTLEADTITAIMKENAQGERVLETLKADGNVRIVTPAEVLTGENGVYNRTSNTAEITGNVQIRRGPNTLEGTKATVDLNTNISRMFGGQGPNGRVRGVFFPGSDAGESAP